MLRYIYPPVILLALRKRRRGWREAEKSASAAASALANYLVEARKLQVDSHRVADATRRLTWVIAGLTIVNVGFVAYSVLR